MNRRRRPIGVTIWGVSLILLGLFLISDYFWYISNAPGGWLVLNGFTIIIVIGVGIMFAIRTAYIASLGLIAIGFTFSLYFSFVPEGGGFAALLRATILLALPAYYLTRPRVREFFSPE